MSNQEVEEPTDGLNGERGEPRGTLKLGRRTVRLLSAIVVLIIVATVLLILWDHVTPVNGTHLLP